MLRKSMLPSALFLFYIIISHVDSTPTQTVRNLQIDDPVHVLQEVGRLGYAVQKMNIFCYAGDKKEIGSLLKTLILHIDIDEDDFSCYTGFDSKEVVEAQESHKSIFSFNLFSHTKKRSIKLNPFNQTCIGIDTSSEYIVTLQLIRIDLSKLALLAGGILTFFIAKKLSNNSAFFYLCGILIGVFASILVLIWFASKLIPKKPLMYGALLSGWTLVAYFAQFFYENIFQILVVYRQYVLIYIATTSILSFGICYYNGPPKSKRSKQLIMWALQALALLAIYLSSDLLEVSVTIMAGCIFLYYGLRRLPIPPLRRWWHRMFPPKRRLLTREEFEEQARIETAKALKELKEFVQSPKCNQWKTVMNLSQPTKFASFVENGEHVTLDETRLHEETINDFSDDDNDSEDSGSSSSDFVDESVHVDQSVNLINKSKVRAFNSYDLQKSAIRNNVSRRTLQTSTPNSKTPVKNGTMNGRSSMSRQQQDSPRRNKTYEISDDDE